jgi:hypothetical protein
MQKMSGIYREPILGLFNNVTMMVVQHRHHHRNAMMMVPPQ